jgi:hypothetical protein
MGLDFYHFPKQRQIDFYNMYSHLHEESMSNPFYVSDDFTSDIKSNIRHLTRKELSLVTCQRNYEGSLKSSWTDGSAPLLCRGRR